MASVAAAALGDLACYLGAIDPAVYARPLEVLSGSTIGQHTRHIIEFYACLVEQAAGQHEPRINYAARRRDLRIETDPDHALTLSRTLAGRLGELVESVPCTLDCVEHGDAGLETRSSIGRELQYNVEHTIHHLAIIKIALRLVAPDIALPEHFGVAPSTIRHRHDACAQ
jgi:hypothetical protein